MHPQLTSLLNFLTETAWKLPETRHYWHQKGLVGTPEFFTLKDLKAYVNSPMLMPEYFSLIYQGKRVDCSQAIAHKVVQRVHIQFLNRGVLEDYLSRGAALVLEGLDIVFPEINEFCAAIDQSRPNVLSNAVVFFSQRGDEAYRGHRDSDDVLVLHLAGQKTWRLHARQAPRRVDLGELSPEKMGPLSREVTMNPGDALFLKGGTPHQVETKSPYSLHISFDIADRNLYPETALELLLEQYNRASASSYAPSEAVVAKLMEHASSPEFKQRIAEAHREQMRNCKQFRGLLSSNVVRVFDKWLASSAQVLAMFFSYHAAEAGMMSLFF
jgi:ribosomal protein L16 Arg81 hydroxylase